MKKVIFVIPQRNFNDKEYSRTKEVLEANLVKVEVSSITEDECVGMYGLRVKPEKSVREIRVEEYDALVMIGGSGSPKLMDYPEVLNIISEFNRRKKIIAAICLAPVILAKTGILKGVMVTVFPVDWAIASLKEEGAHYSDRHVIVDGNIITADGPDSAEKFAVEIVKELKKI